MTLHIHDHVEQGSEEWFALRRGVVTASTVGQLVTVSTLGALDYECPTCLVAADEPCISLSRKAPTPIQTIHKARTGHAAEKAKDAPPVFETADNEASRNLTAVLAAERITGFTEDTPTTSDMFRGTMAEPFARDAYSKTYAPATEIGFMAEDRWGFTIGLSPDGLVGDEGLIEIKSPRAKTHVRTVLADAVPAHYMAQLQCALLVSGRAWCDFISYLGGQPLYVKRVFPDPAWQDAIVLAVAEFEVRAEQIVSDYLARIDGLPKTERIDPFSDLDFSA